MGDDDLAAAVNGSIQVPFCAPTDSTALLGVLGVFSHHTNTHLRATLRETWMHGTTRINDILVRFVVRGVGASERVATEAGGRSAAVSDLAAWEMDLPPHAH